MGGHLQHLWLHRGRVLVFFLIVHSCSIQAFAETKHHHHGKTAAKAEPFIISTDKPFDTLMYEAMDIMHRDMGTAEMDGGPDHDFITMMIPHHQGAVDMAKILLIYGKDIELRNLAQRIITGQHSEIKIMQEWLKRHRSREIVKSEPFATLMEKANVSMHKDMGQAEKTGNPDHDFVTMMIPHHQGAVDMANVLLMYGKDLKLRILSQNIITEQQYEIQAMKAWLTAHQPTGPKSQDRVYTADQNSNTVSVINPATNMLLGQIRLGNMRPDVLSPLYKGELNVHGLGFSPDRKTLIAISTGSNSVTFIDTSTNKVKGITYVGRSPHEGFFTPDGKEAWVVVRSENYISVIDPKTYKEIRRIETTPGPGMVIFNPNGKYAYVCNSFNPVFEVIDVAQYKVIKKISVVSPFSPYLVMTPDYKEIWLTHKDVGKITRIDAEKLEIIGVFDTGFITNHIHFAKAPQGILAHVTIGGENAVKVFTTETVPKLITTISVGALPHGIWPSDDGSRMYIGLENSDAVDVIDTSLNKVVARIPVGQAPQALVYVSNAAPEGGGTISLAPRQTVPEPINIQLKATEGDARGFVVVRNMGLVDAFEVSVFKLKPDTIYKVYISGQKTPVALLKTNPKGMSNVTTIGPLRETITTVSPESPEPSQILVMEGDEVPDLNKAILLSVL